MTRKIVILIFLAFAIRIASTFILGRHIKPEVWECDTIALNILAGNGYVYRYLNNTCYFYYSSPLYVYFEAFAHYLTNKNYMILEIIQLGIAALSIIPLFYIAKHIFNEKTAMISGVLYCFHPGLIVYATKIHELILIIFCILAIIAFLVRFKDRWWNLLLMGILIGMGILLRPTVIFIIPAIFIYILVKNGYFGKAVLKTLVIFLVTTIIISPWIYRGYKIYNRFIFVTSTSAEHFWRGNNPLASGTGLTKDNKPIFSQTDRTFKNKVFSLNEMEQYNFFKYEAIKYIRNNPKVFLKNTAKKFIYFWSFSPQIGLRYPAKWAAIYKIVYFFLALFSILGLYFIFVNKRRKIELAFVLFLFAFFAMISLTHSLFYVEMRHRWAVEPLLLIFTAHGLISSMSVMKKALK